MKRSSHQVILHHAEPPVLEKSVLAILKGVDTRPGVAVYGPTWMRESAVIEIFAAGSDAALESFNSLLFDLVSQQSGDYSIVGTVQEEETARETEK